MRAFSFLRQLALFMVWGFALGSGALYYAYSEFAKELPTRLEEVMDYRPARATRVTAKCRCGPLDCPVLPA